MRKRIARHNAVVQSEKMKVTRWCRVEQNMLHTGRVLRSTSQK